MATSILPRGDFGRPLSSRVQVTPLSREVNTPLPGPPPFCCQVRWETCQVPANNTLGLPGSMLRPEQPVSWLTNSVRFQVLPPSVVRNTPRSCCGAEARPSAHTSTLFGSRGLITMREMRPVSVRPMCCQVLPASVDLYTPSPQMSLGRMNQRSPVPTHTVSASEGATAIAPIADVSWSSKIGRNVCPPSVDFHSPPDAAPR